MLFGQHMLVGAKSLAKKVIFVRTSMDEFMKTYLYHRPANEKKSANLFHVAVIQNHSPDTELFILLPERGP